MMRRFGSIPTSATPSRRRFASAPSAAAAALVAAVALLPLLGAKPLTDWDEAIYAEVAREMLSLGWLVPHWNFQPWFEKPPLAMWITSALYHLFGVTEFAARASSALAGVATVGVLHGWIAKKWGLLAAWLSTAILLTTFGFLHACHTGELDTLLSLGCVIAIIGLAEVGEGDAGGWYFFWAGFAIAVMTKGAAAAVLPIAAVVLVAAGRTRLGTGRRAFWVRGGFWIGGALFCVVVLPWHLAMFHRFGGVFVDEYFGRHVLTRATHQIEGHTNPWWFFFKVLLVSAPPFVLLYPAAIADALRRRELRVLAIFALVVVIFYTVVQTRLPQYIVPAYPALAAVTGIWLAERLRPLLGAHRPGGFWVQVAVVVAAVSIASVWLTAPARKGLHSVQVGDGMVRADNRESIALLRGARLQMETVPGPLVLWRRGPISSIATDVFYARREVQQVTLLPVAANFVRDRYIFDPVPLADAVDLEPRLILLDRDLRPELPDGFTYKLIEARGQVELGSIARVR